MNGYYEENPSEKPDPEDFIDYEVYYICNSGSGCIFFWGDLDIPIESIFSNRLI